MMEPSRHLSNRLESSFDNEYCGYDPFSALRHSYSSHSSSSSSSSSSSLPVAVERVSADGISPEDFFHQFVLARRPALLVGFASSHFNKLQKWTNDYLKRKVGHCAVRVEVRDELGEFGKGRNMKMSFKEFIERMRTNTDYSFYMTTQEIPEDQNGPRKLCGPPLDQLLDDISLRPPLMGRLAPYQINMWMGHSEQGSSSGLHHDYHDNLYVLLRGRKRFTLFCPNLAGHMYTRGQICKVHPNGLISYTDCMTRADGSRIFSSSEEVDFCDDEGVSDSDLLFAGGFGDGTAGAASDDEADEAARMALLQVLSRNSLDVEPEDDMKKKHQGDELPSHSNKRPRQTGVMKSTRPTKTSKKTVSRTEKRISTSSVASDSAVYSKQSTQIKGTRSQQKGSAPSQQFELGVDELPTKEPEPDSFSCVPVRVVRGEDSPLAFPLFAEVAARRLVCEVSAGDVLFLPAGWFHEVTSFSRPTARRDPGHLALNYWYYPPDGDSFAHPYKNEFWEKRFRQNQSS